MAEDDRDDVTRLDAAMQSRREPLEAQLAALRTQFEAHRTQLQAQIAELRELFETLERRRAQDRIRMRLDSAPAAAPTPITAEDLDRKFDTDENISAHIKWESPTRPGRDAAHIAPEGVDADGLTYFREDWLRYTVTDMPPKGPIAGLLLVVDDGRPLIYRYLQVVKFGELGGHDQVLVANGATDFTTDKGQDLALRAFRAAAGNG